VAHSRSVEGVDLRTDQSLAMLPHLSSPILHLWSPWPNQLAAATSDGSIQLWDLRKLSTTTTTNPPVFFSSQTSLSCFTSHPSLKNLVAL
jgi:WD40 repeat protein